VAVLSAQRAIMHTPHSRTIKGMASILRTTELIRRALVQKRQFGSTDREVAVVGQGTWFIEEGEPSLTTAALRRGLDLGMTHIDTAELYGSGAAEKLVGQAIAGRRDEVYLVSKVLPNHASRPGVMAACEGSLARLGTDRLDCYLLHWPGSHPLHETIAGFEELQRQGKILSWGVSNFDVGDLEEVRRIAGSGHPACNQVLYHLQEHAIENAVLPWCERHGVAVVGYSPFGHKGGLPAHRTSRGRVLAEVAAAHGATARQVALAFLVRKPPLFTIPKSSSPDHTAENAGAGDLQLSEDEIARIDQAFPLDRRARPLPTL
jgi:diketogulonate reductase-like aldo/keto reductase